MDHDVQVVARNTRKMVEHNTPLLDLEISCGVEPYEDRAEFTLVFDVTDTTIQNKDDLCRAAGEVADAARLFYEQLKK